MFSFKHYLCKMKVKKCTSFLLALLLLISNIGIAFNVHYCGDSIASISLKSESFSIISKKDCCNVVEKTSHCCKNKIVHFEKKSNNSIIKVFSFELFTPSCIRTRKPISFVLPSFEKSNILLYYCDAHAPPLFKLYSQYIFYA
jgi:hypothetical protein